MTKKQRRKKSFKTQVVRNESRVENQVNGNSIDTVNVDAKSTSAGQADDGALSEPITMKTSPALKRKLKKATEEHCMARSEFIRDVVEVAVRHSSAALAMDMDPAEMIEEAVELYLKMKRHQENLEEALVRDLVKKMAGNLLDK